MLGNTIFGLYVSVSGRNMIERLLIFQVLMHFQNDSFIRLARNKELRSREITIGINDQEGERVKGQVTSLLNYVFSRDHHPLAPNNNENFMLL